MTPDQYEAWVAKVAGVSTSDLGGRHLAAVYRRVSAQITGRSSLGEVTTSPDGANEEVMVRALVYGQRTALILRHLLSPTWLEGRRVVDVGAGTGAGSLFALEAGADGVVSLEAGQGELNWLRSAQRVHVHRDRWHIQSKSTTWRDLQPELGDRWLFLFSFLEIAGGQPRAGRSALQRLVDAGCQITIVEAGTREAAHALAALRDDLADQVSAPCPARERCPRGPNSRDWCHFTWKRSLGPAATALAQGGGRRSNLLHFSYLQLGPAGPQVTEGRLLEVERRGRRTRTLRICTQDGERAYEVDRRDRSLWDWTDQREANDRVGRPGSADVEPGARDPRLRRPLPTPCPSTRST